MMRKIASWIVSLLMLFCLIPTAYAAELPVVIDNALLLTPTEIQLLEDQIQQVRQTEEMDIVILTVDTLDGAYAQDYADDYLDQNGYGYAGSDDCILFLLAMSEREWYISTCGNAIYAVTDYGVQQLGETAAAYLSDGDYYGAFSAYVALLSDYLGAYRDGSPMDGYADYSGDYYHGDQEEILYYEEDSGPDFFLSLLVGIAAGTIGILVMRSSMNTKRPQHSASGYLNPGTFHLRTHQDLFLYSNVSKVRRQQNNTGSRSGGGSSVHRSSGGRRHGGGGGKF